MDLIVTEEELQSLNQAVLKRYAIDFTCYEPKSLLRRVQRSLSVFKINSIAELWMRCLKEDGFIHKLVNELTVGMTSMFRDPAAWRSIKYNMMPNLEKQKEIKIWHAGCSTGEEVYSMGILLHELGLYDKARVTATDINQNAIETSKKGEYHYLKLTEYNKNFFEYNSFSTLDDYYESENSHIAFNKKLISHVKFQYHNLITEDPPGEFDVVLCRNVMIYFDTDAKIKLIKRICDSLKPGGFFIIGFYDTLIPLIEQTDLKYFDKDAKIFQK